VLIGDGRRRKTAASVARPAGILTAMPASGLGQQCAHLLSEVAAALQAAPLNPADVVEVTGDLLGQPPDLVIRRSGTFQVVYLDSITDGATLQSAILEPVRQGNPVLPPVSPPLRTYGEAVSALLEGKALLVDAVEARTVGIQKWPGREPTEPPAEVVPQGPHNGFVEVLQTNLALLRHRIPDARLRWEQLSAGTRAPTSAALFWVQDVARPELVQRVRERLRRASPSFAEDTSMLQEWMTSGSGWLFPISLATERPDAAAAALLEGRTVLLLSGSPVAIIAPSVFADLLHAPTDYYNRPFDALLKRSVRSIALLLSLTITAFYVALVTINVELLPFRMYISAAQSRLGVPMPVLLEVVEMELAIEMVREAGIRMPGGIGQTIGIVGAVIIGQSAVMAGLISAPVVVVVSMAYITSAVLPSLDGRAAIRALRFPLILLAAVFGLFGLIWGLMMLLIYLLQLESFGVPYLAPVTPLRRRGLQDTLWRAPLPQMRRGFLARGGGAR